MVEKKQFTLRFLFIEILVLAIGLWFVRLSLVSYSPSFSGFAIFLYATSRPALAAQLALFLVVHLSAHCSAPASSSSGYFALLQYLSNRAPPGFRRGWFFGIRLRRRDIAMPDKHQFTLKWLLVETALIAVFLGMLRWFFFTNHDDDTVLETQLMLCVGIPVGLACFGAAIGGLFGTFIRGAVGAMVFLLLMALWDVFFPPYQLIKAMVHL